MGIVLCETDIAVRPPVLAACELPGCEPLHVANDGKLLAIVAGERADEAMRAMRWTREGEDAVLIGAVAVSPPIGC